MYVNDKISLGSQKYVDTTIDLDSVDSPILPALDKTLSLVTGKNMLLLDVDGYDVVFVKVDIGNENVPLAQ